MEASNEKDKLTWITALTELKSEIFKIKKGEYIDENEMVLEQSRARANTNNVQKKWKANNIDKSTMEVIKIFNYIIFYLKMYD